MPSPPNYGGAIDMYYTIRALFDLGVQINLHVFTYSERAHTHALTIKPVIPVSVRQERNKILRQLSYQKMQAFARSFEGTTRPVLFEQAEKDQMMEGYTDNYIRVTTPYRAEWVNQLVNWKL